MCRPLCVCARCLLFISSQLIASIWQWCDDTWMDNALMKYFATCDYNSMHINGNHLYKRFECHWFRWFSTFSNSHSAWFEFVCLFCPPFRPPFQSVMRSRNGCLKSIRFYLFFDIRSDHISTGYNKSQFVESQNKCRKRVKWFILAIFAVSPSQFNAEKYQMRWYRKLRFTTRLQRQWHF